MIEIFGQALIVLMVSIVVGFLIMAIPVYLRRRFYAPAIVAAVLLVLVVFFAGPTVWEIVCAW